MLDMTVSRPIPPARPRRIRHRHSIAALAILAFTLVAVTLAARAAQPAPDNTLTNQQIVQRIDAAVYQRLNAIPRYTVQEQYNIYRNSDTKPAAEETIQTTYVRSQGKDYKPLAQSGSSLLRSAVIDKVLASEKDLNLPANREGALITSRNYDLQPEPGTVERNGKTCIIVDLRPRSKSPHLFNGKAWFDVSDFAVVRLEGTPSASPSFFAGKTAVARDYVKVEGYAMATHAEAHSHSALFGDTLLTIDYTGYHIDLDPQASTATH